MAYEIRASLDGGHVRRALVWLVRAETIAPEVKDPSLPGLDTGEARRYLASPRYNLEDGL